MIIRCQSGRLLEIRTHVVEWCIQTQTTKATNKDTPSVAKTILGTTIEVFSGTEASECVIRLREIEDSLE